MKLVDKWYKAWSTWLSSASIFLSGLQMFVPDIQQALAPEWYRYAFAIILIARIIQQNHKPDPNA